MHGGFLIYLRQEGRGIGLYSKMDAYLLQTDGVDTYDANLALGYESDSRSYQAAAEILIALGYSHIRLLSNNPDKRRQLEMFGINIEDVVPTSTFLTRHNQEYLKAKSDKTNHTINVVVDSVRENQR